MTEDHHFRVASRCELLPYLISLPLGLSRKKAKVLLRFQAVTVRHKGKLRHDTQLDAGDIVAIAAGKTEPDATLRRHSLKIVHLDDTIVVVEKPEGLLAMGSEREKERTVHRLLNEYLKAVTKSRLQQAFIVHRLDRETSGLMIFARDESHTGGPSAELEECPQKVSRYRGGRAPECAGNAQRPSGGEQSITGSPR
jgi:23S rRNA pseudouridine1911/1915/1917 synthase